MSFTDMERRMSDNANRPAFASSRKTAARYDRDVRTLDRWLETPGLGFPAPMYINGKRYWSIKALEEWERARAASHAAPK
jgi:hypothetical protein